MRRLGACLDGLWHAFRHPGFFRAGWLCPRTGLAGSGRGPGAPGRGQRVDAHPPSSVRRGPGSERIRAFFISGFNRPAHRHRPAINASHHRSWWTLFNKLPQGSLGTGRWHALHLFADAAQLGEHGHAMCHGGPGPRVRDSSSAPLRVCPCTPWPRDMVLAARDVRGPWPDHVQRDTTSDGMLAFGHSRSGISPS